MPRQISIPANSMFILSAAGVLFGLYLSSLYSYLLFHSLVEMFGVIVACGIFMIAWNSRRFLDNNYLLFIGISYLFVGALDLVHTLAYKGMNIFRGFDANLPTQLWIAARYMGSISLFLAPLFLERRLRHYLTLLIYAAVTALALGSILYLRNFPESYIEGAGLTRFKIISEYMISLILLSSIALVYKKRERFDPAVLRLLIASIILNIGAELAFTFYIGVYDLSNRVGHFFKFISLYLFYKALIETALVKPYNLLFRNLKKKEEALENKTLELERSNADLDHFASVVSHDLKEPLSTVGGFADLLDQNYGNGLDEKGRKFVGYIIDGVTRMELLIGDLLSYARVSTGEKTFKPVHCGTVLGVVLSNLKAAIEESDADITSDDLPVVIGDETQLIQLFQNVIGNAIKYRSDMPPRVHVSARPVSDAAVESDVPHTRSASMGGWLFSVSDNGIGIAAVHFERIFQIFQRLHQGGKYEGTGIGLAVSKKIVERHNGRIWVESEPGKGSTFHFTIK